MENVARLFLCHKKSHCHVFTIYCHEPSQIIYSFKFCFLMICKITSLFVQLLIKVNIKRRGSIFLLRKINSKITFLNQFMTLCHIHILFESVKGGMLELKSGVKSHSVALQSCLCV